MLRLALQLNFCGASELGNHGQDLARIFSRACSKSKKSPYIFYSNQSTEWQLFCPKVHQKVRLGADRALAVVGDLKDRAAGLVNFLDHPFEPFEIMVIS